MLYAGGAKFLMLLALLYAPVTMLFVIARREQKVRIFARVELLLFGVIAVAATAGLYSLASGAISV
jgi:arginine:ornithine antiporter/lysine permease